MCTSYLLHNVKFSIFPSYKTLNVKLYARHFYFPKFIKEDVIYIIVPFDCPSSHACCISVLLGLIRGHVYRVSLSVTLACRCSKSHVAAIRIAIVLSSRGMHRHPPRATSLIAGWKGREGRLRLIDNSWPVTGARDMASAARIRFD